MAQREQNLTRLERKILETSVRKHQREREIYTLLKGIDPKDKTILNIGAGKSSKSVKNGIIDKNVWL